MWAEEVKFEEVYNVSQNGRKSGPGAKATVSPGCAASVEERRSGVTMGSGGSVKWLFIGQSSDRKLRGGMGLKNKGFL